jgi:hypothetical protein
MKKGFCVIGLLVFTIIVCTQNVMANVTLNVNAKSSKLANKIYYNDLNDKLVTVSLPWKEKAVYDGDGEIAITVNNKLAGDLIVKVDIVTSSDGEMTVSSGWLKYGSDSGPFENTMKVIYIVADGGIAPTADGDPPAEEVHKEDLGSLCLEKGLKANTTINLFNFITSFNSPSHIIFTALLLENAAPTSTETPKVIGVDIQTVLFNYTGTQDKPEDPIWLNLISNSSLQ